MVVKEDGSPLNPSAYLELVLTNEDGVVSPYYEVTHKAPPNLPVRNAPLTGSEVAHVRGVLDRRFVLAAHPATDGIEVLQSGSAWTANWDVPTSVTALRFSYRCAATDEFVVEVKDITPGKAAKRTAEQTIACAGVDATVDFPDPPDVVTIRTAVHERRATPTAVPEDVRAPFLVELVPVS